MGRRVLQGNNFGCTVGRPVLVLARAFASAAVGGIVVHLLIRLCRFQCAAIQGWIAVHFLKRLEIISLEWLR